MISVWLLQELMAYQEWGCDSGNGRGLMWQMFEDIAPADLQQWLTEDIATYKSLLDTKLYVCFGKGVAVRRSQQLTQMTKQCHGKLACTSMQDMRGAYKGLKPYARVDTVGLSCTVVDKALLERLGLLLYQIRLHSNVTSCWCRQLRALSGQSSKTQQAAAA